MVALHDWTAPAAHAAALLDADAATALQRMLDRTPRHTPWVAAATATAAATVAADQGRKDVAVRRYLDAADYYDTLGAAEYWIRSAMSALALDAPAADPRVKLTAARLKTVRPVSAA
jgi:hypothetical protein